MSYKDLNYLTPQSLKNKYTGKRFFIIGSGTSTKDLIKYSNKICSKFDVVIGINQAVFEFEDQMNYHFIIEKNPVKIFSQMKDGTYDYRRDIPRILNWKAIQHFPSDFPIYKTTRNGFGGKADIREYQRGDVEGLLVGPPDPKGFLTGTASMQALHLACIMGAKEVYLVGVDLVFKDQYDHFYPDKSYRNSTTKKANRSPIVKVDYKGKQHETVEAFKYSAKFFDTVINTLCKPAGINVYDFSDGLITAATKVNIDNFFGGE